MSRPHLFRMIIAPLLGAAILLPAAGENRPSLPESLPLIAPGAFHSKEDLLQMFYSGYRSGRLRTVALGKDSIRSLAARVKTLFPLERCEAIVLRNDTLRFSFPEKQSRTIPGTYRQAALVLSPQVAFVLSPDPADKSRLVFRVVEGAVTVHFSFLSQWRFGMRRIDGNELFYGLDTVRHSSIIGLNCRGTIPRSHMSIARRDSTTTVTISGHALKGKNSMVFSPSRMEMFGIAYRILGGDSLQCGATVFRDPLMRRQVMEAINEVVREPDTSRLFMRGIDSVRSAVYELEARRISLSFGFQKKE